MNALLIQDAKRRGNECLYETEDEGEQFNWGLRLKGEDKGEYVK